MKKLTILFVTLLLNSISAHANYYCEAILNQKSTTGTFAKVGNLKFALRDGSYTAGSFGDLYFEKKIDPDNKEGKFEVQEIELGGVMNGEENQQAVTILVYRIHYVAIKADEYDKQLATLNLKGNATASVEFENYQMNVVCNTKPIK